jgi:hypothetical protein
MSEVSARAKKCEDEAKLSFLAAETKFAGSETIKTLPFGKKHTIPLLKPDCHLTAFTWASFR